MSHKNQRIPVRQKRLAKAEQWLKTYEGKNLVRGYRKRFNVNRLCALIELKILGQPIRDEEIEAARLSEGQCQEVCARQKARTALALYANHEFDGIQNGTFAYIAGYTSGGFPYGITWDEMEAADIIDGHGENMEFDDCLD